MLFLQLRSEVKAPVKLFAVRATFSQVLTHCRQPPCRSRPFAPPFCAAGVADWDLYFLSPTIPKRTCHSIGLYSQTICSFQFGPPQKHHFAFPALVTTTTSPTLRQSAVTICAGHDYHVWANSSLHGDRPGQRPQRGLFRACRDLLSFGTKLTCFPSQIPSKIKMSDMMDDPKATEVCQSIADRNDSAGNMER